MKRMLPTFIVIAVLLLTSCSFGPLAKAKATETPVPIPPTQEPTATDVLEEPTWVPTSTPIPTAEPTPELVGQAEGDFFSETFGAGLDNWEIKFIAGNERDTEIEPSEGELRIKEPEKETYLYFWNKTHNYQDVVIDAEAENIGSNGNGFALVCRMTQAGWYEVRISSGGEYAFYRYDQKLRDDNQNPYVQLGGGGSNRIKTGPKVNQFKMTCIGSEIRLFVNGEEIRAAKKIINDKNFSDGQVGFGMISSSSNVLAVWHFFKTSQP
jgi:hypothetical protein